MSEKHKTLCGWKKKDIEKHFDELADLVRKPTHVCLRCGRAAADKKILCKPAKLD